MKGNNVNILLVSMEAALESDIPTYAGGLGVLVGDKIKASRDMKKSIDVVTFSYPLGYAHQEIIESNVFTKTNHYNPSEYFKLENEFTLKTKFGNVPIKLLRGKNSWIIDTDYAKSLYIENTPIDRLKKEIILGMVSAKIFNENNFDILHLEESHAAFASNLIPKDKRVVFTTHTPLAHGHEVWDKIDVAKLFGGNENNMTKLALSRANYVNCVSRLQRDVMNEHLDNRSDYITNGVHISWLNKHIEKLIGNVRSNPEKLVFASSLDLSDLVDAKAKSKSKLVKLVNESAYKIKDFDSESFTIGIARRFTGYKRLDMILREIDVLDQMSEKHPIQILFSGAAHPSDTQGIETIKHVVETAKRVKNLKIAYLPHYNLDSAKTMISGSDVWLNVPYEEKEASGTSWMKAMMNGTILISTLSGSVPEFAIHKENSLLIPQGNDDAQTKALLENINYIISMGKHRFELSRAAIATSAGLTARRMMKEYFSRAYLEQ